MENNRLKIAVHTFAVLENNYKPGLMPHNINSMKKLFFILSAALMISCTGAKQDANVLVPIPVNVEDNQTEEILKNVQIKRITALDNSHSIGTIPKAEIYENKIYIFNKSADELICLDNNGKLNFTINAKGRGPKEYITIQNFYIDEISKQVNIVSPDNRILKYNYSNGELQDVTPLNCSTMMVLDAMRTNSGDLAVYTMGMQYNLEIFKTGADTSFKYIPFIESRDMGFSSRAFSNIDNNPVFAHGTSDYIYNILDDGVMPKYFIDFGSYGITLELYTSNPAAVQGVYEAQKVATKLDDLIETEDYLAFSYLVFPPKSFNVKKQYVLYNKDCRSVFNLPADTPLFPIADCNNGLFASIVNIAAIENSTDNSQAITQLKEFIQQNNLSVECNPLLVWWTIK